MRASIVVLGPAAGPLRPGAGRAARRRRLRPAPDRHAPAGARAARRDVRVRARLHRGARRRLLGHAHPARVPERGRHRERPDGGGAGQGHDGHRQRRPRARDRRPGRVPQPDGCQRASARAARRSRSKASRSCIRSSTPSSPIASRRPRSWPRSASPAARSPSTVRAPTTWTCSSPSWATWACGSRPTARACGRWRPKRLRAVDVATLPYPGLATDYKPLLVAMLAIADGVGIVTENLFAGRFRYVDELVRMGADIRTESHHAVVRGKPMLSGAPVRAPDIRAGAALGAWPACGPTARPIVYDAEHLDRGYEHFVEKLRSRRRRRQRRVTLGTQRPVLLTGFVECGGDLPMLATTARLRQAEHEPCVKRSKKSSGDPPGHPGRQRRHHPARRRMRRPGRRGRADRRVRVLPRLDRHAQGRHRAHPQGSGRRRHRGRRRRPGRHRDRRDLRLPLTALLSQQPAEQSGAAAPIGSVGEPGLRSRPASSASAPCPESATAIPTARAGRP